MSEAKKYIQKLFDAKSISIPSKRNDFFDAFISEEKNITAVQQISELQNMIMNDWNTRNRIQDIVQQHVTIPNGTVNKMYEASIDPAKNNWDDLLYFNVILQEDSGLIYSSENHSIIGTPSQSGDLKIIVQFKIKGEKEDAPLNEKYISIAINPDPKSLWKNEPSDSSDQYWKEDNAASAGELGDRFVVAASKRGRSHANVGSFREDDFAYKHFTNNGWSVVAVSDGAGSSKMSRIASKLACESVLEWFSTNLTAETSTEFDRIVQAYKTETNEESTKNLNHFIYNNLFKTPIFVHQKIAELAVLTEKELKDFYATLIYTAFKKYDFGYVIFSFGVGDCPIGLLNKDLSEITLMNWLDVGEYGGGTRFITMPEVLSSDKYNSRFKLKIVDDFSYLMLMTDGIYDPKFEVEVNLEKLDKWQTFVDDLKGKNDDGVAVEFSRDNKEIAKQLSTWMDFWSPGNHDDRTLAVIFNFTPQHEHQNSQFNHYARQILSIR